MKKPRIFKWASLNAELERLVSLNTATACVDARIIQNEQDLKITRQTGETDENEYLIWVIEVFSFAFYRA